MSEAVVPAPDHVVANAHGVVARWNRGQCPLLRESSAWNAVVDLSGVLPVSPVRGRVAISQLCAALQHHWAGLKLELLELVAVGETSYAALVLLHGPNPDGSGGMVAEELACVVSQRPDFEQIVRCEVYRSLDQALEQVGPPPAELVLVA